MRIFVYPTFRELHTFTVIQKDATDKTKIIEEIRSSNDIVDEGSAEIVAEGSGEMVVEGSGGLSATQEM